MRVWRVSSHATTSASRKPRSTRSVTSSRLPIGVGHTTSLPFAGARPSVTASSRRHWANIESPMANGDRPQAAVHPLPRGPEAAAPRPWGCGRERVGGAGAQPRGQPVRRRSRRPAAAPAASPPGHARPARSLPGGGGSPPSAPCSALLALIVGWLALSLVLFLVSSHFQRISPPANVASQLESAGFLLTSANNILVLGSDKRQKDSKGTGRRHQRAQPLGLDHADPHRRRACRAPLDSARHGDRNPRSRAAEDQRRLRLRRPRRVDLGDQALPRRPDQPSGRGQLRKLPRSWSKRWVASPTPAAAWCPTSTAAPPTAASRCASPPAPTSSTAGKRSRSRAPARTCCAPQQTDLNREERQQTLLRTCSRSCSPPRASCACR